MIVQPLTAKQRAAVTLSRAHRLTVYEGSVRSSKTVTSVLDWLAFVRAAPPGPLLMVGKTERTLERNVIGPLVEMLGRRRCRFVRGAGELHLLGRLVFIAGANDMKSQEKIRGVTLVGAYVDEASLVPESFWSMLVSRLSVAGARLIATTNPDSPRSWLKRDYLDRARTELTRRGTQISEALGNGRTSSADVRVRLDRPPEEGDPSGLIDLARLSFHLDDNPTLDPAFRTSLDTMYVGLWRRRFIDGDWVAAEGAIYDMLDLGPGGAHRIPWVKVRRRLTGRFWLGVDYGQSNPFHAVLLGATDTELVVCGEWRYDGRTAHRQLSDPEYETRLRGWLDAGAGLPLPPGAHEQSRAGEVWPERTAVDPSAASFRTMLRTAGWSGLTAADNAVADGIRAVASLLAARRLLFAVDERGDPAAPELERELLGYTWDPKATDKGLDEPLKADDHGADALRYGVMSCRSAWRPWLQQGLQLAA